MKEPGVMTSKDTSQKWLLLSIILIMLLLCIPAPGGAIVVNCSEPTQPALLKELTPLFNLSAIRPVNNLRTCTNVTLFFTMYGILGVNEKDQLLITYIWGESWWQNEFVSWDPEQCGTKKISLPRNKFWVPDIVINEFIDENTAPYVPYVFLHSDGKVYDSQPIKVISSCNLDIYTFPFDIQHCHLTFNSYIHQAKDIKILLGKSAELITAHSKKVMATIGEWELLHIEATKEILEGVDDTVIDELMFHVEIRRRPTLYVVNLLIPSCFLITVDLFSFLLPPQKVDRSSFKMTLILGYTVFLLIMNDLLPITGNTIPLINVFFSLCLALMVASLLETVFITNLLLNSENFAPVPHWVRVLVLQILGRLVRLPMKKKTPRHSVAASSSVQTPAPKSQEEKGPMVEDKALEQLKNLSKDLKAVRLQVEKQLQGNQSSEEWVQWFPMKVKSSKILFILLSLIMHAPCGALNCSEPNPPALLDALRPVFNMSSIRPVFNLSTPTDVRVDFILVGILGVDEKTQILTTYIFQFMMWRNEFVSWDEEECGSGWITVPRNLLWVPDIVINEFMNKNSAPLVPYTYLYNDGTVLDERPVRVVSSCRLDIYAFPFDTQNCSLTFTSFFHQSSAMTLNQLFSVEEMLELSKHLMKTLGEWELIGMTAKKTRVPPREDPYEQIVFYVVLKRRATLYVMNLLIPSGFLVTVDLLSFMLPPKSVDRSLFKMTLILGYTVFLLIMNDLLPITGNSIPLINVFLSLCLGLMVASLLETIVITNVLHNSARYGPVPRWVQLLVIHFLGRLVRIPPEPKDPDVIIENPDAQEMIVAKENRKPAEKVEESGIPELKGPLAEDRTLEQLRSLAKDLQAIRLQVDEHLQPNQDEKEWLQVGFIIDRLLFILYILFLSISCITINVLMLTSG